MKTFKDCAAAETQQVIMNQHNSLQINFGSLLEQLPATSPQVSTFLEIAGFPHYENVCSNLLRFFFTPNPMLRDLDGLLLRCLLTCAGRNDIADPATTISVRREVVTNRGRIDLLLETKQFVIAIENKIFHYLNNDLEEYAQYIESNYKNKQSLKIVLSIRPEKALLKGGFINIRYESLMQQVMAELALVNPVSNPDYFTIFFQFVQTLKRLAMPIELQKEEFDFLLNNESKIDELIALHQKKVNFINQRAHTIKEAIRSEQINDPWVYEGYDVGFHYEKNGLRFKVECLLHLSGISIVICVEQNHIDWKALEKLNLFRSGKGQYLLRENEEGNRVVIKDGIAFDKTSDEELAALLIEISRLVDIEDDFPIE